jgi:hypothetical protein
VMSLVDLARQVRQVSMEVDFRARKLPVTPIAAHIEQFHTTAFQFGQHQVPHLVRSQLWQMQRIANPVEKILDGPFRDGLAWIALRVREKNGASSVATVALDESSAIPLDVLASAEQTWSERGQWCRATCSW